MKWTKNCFILHVRSIIFPREHQLLYFHLWLCYSWKYCTWRSPVEIFFVCCSLGEIFFVCCSFRKYFLSAVHSWNIFCLLFTREIFFVCCSFIEIFLSAVNSVKYFLILHWNKQVSSKSVCLNNFPIQNLTIFSQNHEWKYVVFFSW